ncbi:MAG: hypothetical protein D6788_10800, partial [Planctomycetota bacterium]
RLVRAYPELADGRFLVIADFEEPKHLELVRLIGVSDHARRFFDPRRGRPETGTGCLIFTSGSPRDAVVFSNESATQWYMKQDWRAYDLFMLSVHVPEEGLALSLTFRGGPAAEPLRTETTVPLRAGWTVVRLDLADIGEQIPLDDVRALRIALVGHDHPVEVRLDDLLLTSFRRTLLGDPEHRDKGLYVQRVGRRWRIGAKNDRTDFELTFARGQIIAWYDMHDDPYRLRNLVRGTSLGPTPVILEEGRIQPRGFAPLGEAVHSAIRILEMNPTRVVVACEWRFVRDAIRAGEPSDAAPVHRWVYTIYPSGQVYAAGEVTVAHGGWRAGKLGLAVGAWAPPNDPPSADVFGPESGGGASPDDVPPHAVLRYGAEGAALLFVPRNAERLRVVREGNALSANPITEAASAGPGGKPEAESDKGLSSETLTLLAEGIGRPVGDGRVRWRAHLVLTRGRALAPEEAARRAREYRTPPMPRLEVGAFSTIRDDRGGEAQGFDPVGGCYVIQPDEGRIRLYLDPRTGPRYSPVLVIPNPQGRQAWVYVDNLIERNVSVTPRGELVFQLPGEIRRRTVVEALFRLPEQQVPSTLTPPP